jgi:hypothetical protein
MPDQRGLLQAVLADEVGHVGGHGGIVMAVLVGRLAVVAEVLLEVLAACVRGWDRENRLTTA